MYMASMKTKEKIGFKDLVTFAKAGWTPEETNALLDRLDAMGDPNDPPADDGDDEEGDDDDDNNDDSDDDVDDSDDNDSLDDDQNREDSNNESDDKDDVTKNLNKMKQLGLEMENERLKKELAKLKAKNRNKDVSGGTTKKSAQDSFTDALQSCF